MDEGRGEPRIDALDGLRGAAALAVVLSHVLLATSAPFADAVVARPERGSHTIAQSALLYTPLHLLWGGHEAVLVFFVLSGFVLALPLARGVPWKLASYYPRRLLRLYLPVWGAFLLTAALHRSISQESVVGGTWWLDAHAASMTSSGTAHDLTLVWGPGGWAYNSVLWSLRWEVIYSILLPLVLVAALATRRMTSLGAVLCFVVLLVARNDAARYLPIFVLGSLMAFERERLAVLGRHAAGRTALLVTALLGLTFSAWFRADDWLSSRLAGVVDNHVGPTIVVFGACATVLVPITVPAIGRVLVTRPAHWAGSRSYSLYLVHEPIVVATAFLLGGRAPTLVLLAIAVPIALLVTEGFHRIVERPAVRVARAVGQRLAVRGRISVSARPTTSPPHRPAVSG